MRTMVQARINGVEAVQKSIAKKEADLKRLRVELETRNDLLIKEIEEKGGTSGDSLRDLVIRVYGLNEEITQQYRALQERLKGCEGEFVMIRYAAQVRQRFGGELRGSDFLYESHFRLGVLRGEELCLERSGASSPTITLPIVQYLQGVWGEGMWRATLEESPVKGDLFEWFGPDENPPLLVDYLRDVKEDIFIGDKAVKAGLARGGNEKCFAQAAERLGRLVLQPTE